MKALLRLQVSWSFQLEESSDSFCGGRDGEREDGKASEKSKNTNKCGGKQR